MRPENFDIAELIADLQGTCKSISDFLPEGMNQDDLTQNDLSEIDQEIFLCDGCGWWCEVSESNDRGGENVCDDCKDEENEDEENEDE